MQYKDYYAVLGVPRDASADVIKKAYRRLARRHHPDVSKQPDAAARMAEINEANAVLGDVERRAAYDALGRGGPNGEPFTPPPGWDAGFEFSGRGFDEAGAGGFSDFFEQLFGHAGAPRGRGRRGAVGGRGADRHAKVVLELNDALRGATRSLTLRMPALDRSGHPVYAEHTLEVRIPAGVRPGQRIRLAGQGDPGPEGPGDLYLEVALAAHPRFAVQGADLVAELPVAPWEAAMGGVVPVDLPAGGTLQVRVPAGAQGGRTLRVRGHGLPASGAQPAGDLELVVRVLLPSALDPRARRLYEAMARELGGEFDARKVAQAERD